MQEISADLTWMLVAVFTAAGILHVIAPKYLRQAYERGDHPVWYRVLIGFINLLTAYLLSDPSYRMMGAALAAMVLFLAIVMLLDRRAYGPALSGFGVLSALWLQVLTATA